MALRKTGHDECLRQSDHEQKAELTLSYAPNMWKTPLKSHDSTPPNLVPLLVDQAVLSEPLQGHTRESNRR